MKATLACLAALLAAPAVHAQWGGPCIPQAPDACGPGYYNANCCGAVYGPNYNLYPCFLPFNGMVLGPKNQGQPGGAGPAGPGMPGYAGQPGMPAYPGAAPSPFQPPAMPAFPTHPFARSPRDFFMVYD